MDPFGACLRNERLKLFEATDELLLTHFAAAKEELFKARLSLQGGRFEPATEHSYFAMHRTCETLVLAAGYRSTNLHSLVVAMSRFYAEPGAIDPWLLDLLKIAKEQKDLVMSGARCNPRDTRLIVNAAERLILRACELLPIPGMEPPEILTTS